MLNKFRCIIINFLKTETQIYDITFDHNLQCIS